MFFNPYHWEVVKKKNFLLDLFIIRVTMELFTYSDTIDGDQYLCECSKSAILNYFELRALILDSAPSSDNNLKSFDEQYLPPGIQGLDISNGKKSIGQLNFKRSICHRCNLVPPTLKYCHDMYGTSFEVHFGWYINQAYLKFGILQGKFLEYVTPQEFVDDLIFIKQANNELNEARKWFSERDKDARQKMMNSQSPESLQQVDYAEIAKHQDILREATTNANRAFRVLSKKIENTVREEFGFKKVGERWVSETLLFRIVEKLFPNQIIKRHFRPPWLHRLELDIFIPDKKLGFEYQGQQHYHPISAWGGLEALKKLQERDSRKKEYCRVQKIELIIVDYTEPLTLDHIRSKIKPHFFESE